jgi:hypothetical protein
VVAADQPGRAFCAQVVGVAIAALATIACFAPRGHGAPGVGLAWLLFVASSGHVAATGALFADPEVRRHAARTTGRFVALPALLVAGGAVAATLAGPWLFGAVLLGFFVVQVWHFQKQNLGLAALAASAARLPSLTRVERRCILAAGLAGCLALLARPQLLVFVPTRLPQPVATAAYVIAAATLVAAAALATTSCERRRRTPGGATGGFVAVLLMAVLFPAPLLLGRSPYAAIGALTLAHGVHYLMLVGQTVLARRATAVRVWRPSPVAGVALVTAVLALAAVLSTLSHLHGGEGVQRPLFGAYVGLVSTHFVLDARLWRLREEFPRRWLRQRLPHLLPVLSG